MLDVTRPDLTGSEWAAMTVGERVAQCRAFAREAAQLGHAAHADLARRYADIAAQWNLLAAQMENGRPPDLGRSTGR
jgi:hypothetical protein